MSWDPFYKMETFKVSHKDFVQWLGENMEEFRLSLTYALISDSNMMYRDKSDRNPILVSDDQVEKYKSQFEYITDGDQDQIVSIKVMLIYLYHNRHIGEGFYYFTE